MNYYSKLIVCSLMTAGLLVSTTSCQEDEITTRAALSAPANAALMPNSYLSTLATYELGVGYSYDITAEWGQGVRYQIFDIVGLDELQQSDRNTYVYDDFQEETLQEIVLSDTRRDLATKLTLGGSIGLGVVAADAKVSGSFTQEDLEERKYSYGTLRIIHSIFTRDLQYHNVLAQASQAKEGYFTPAFREDWEGLQKYNSLKDNDPDLNKLASEVTIFLNRWGIAFVSKGWMGGYLNYELAIEKAYLSEALTVEGALEAELANVVEAKGSVSYREALTQISGHYQQTFLAAGGNVQLVSIITNNLNENTDTSHIQFEEWTKSFVWNRGLLADNCILANFRLVSIATLFDGHARAEIDKQIEAMTFNK